MPSVGTASVDLEVDRHHLGRSITAATGSVGNEVRSSFSGLGKLATVAFAGAFAVKAVDFLGDSVREAREAAIVGRQTAAVLKSTGAVANVSAKGVGELATQLSNLTGIDDEAIQSGENLLLTFTNIRNAAGKGNDIFTQATKTLTDFAVRFTGGNLETAAIQIGKALNDPIRGVTALQRVGVSFTKAQKDQIKTLVESGKTMEAQKLILRELRVETAGAAEAAADPAKKLSVVINNLKETVGTAMLPVLNAVATFLSNKLPRAVDTAGHVLGPIVDVIKRVVSAFSLLSGGNGGVAGFAAAMDKLVSGGGKYVELFTTIGTAIVTTATFIHDNFVPIVAVLAATLLAVTSPVTAVVVALALLYARFQVVRDVVDEVVTVVIQQVQQFAAFMQSVLPQVQEAIGHFAAVVQAVWHAFGDDLLMFMTGVWTAIGGLIQGAVTIIENVIRLFLAVVNGDWSAAWDALKGIVEGVWVAIRGVVVGSLEQLRGAVGVGFEALRATAGTALSHLLELVASLPSKIIAALGNLGDLLIRAGQDLIGGFINGIKSKIGALAHAVGDAVSHLPGVVKKILHIGSPSKVFIEIGEQTMEGFEVGVQNEQTEVERVMGQLAESAAGAFSPKLLVAEDGSLVPESFYAATPPNHAGQPGFVQAEDGSWVPLSFYKMHTGGIVPGWPGQEVLTLLEAGETVVPADNGSSSAPITALLSQLLDEARKGHVIAVDRQVLGRVTSQALKHHEVGASR